MEFVQAGDKLISVCKDWSWNGVTDKKMAYEELPSDKQFLSVRVRCLKRIKDLRVMAENMVEVNPQSKSLLKAQGTGQ